MLGGGGYDKSFSRVYHITSMKHGHSANYRNKQLGVDEFFNPMDWHDARQYNATSPGKLFIIFSIFLFFIFYYLLSLYITIFFFFFLII